MEMHTTDVIAGYWHEVKGKLKQQWGKLTDDDIEQLQGTEEELCGVLQKKYGYGKDQAENEIDNFLRREGFKEENGE